MGRQTIRIHEIEGLTCEMDGLTYKIWKPNESLETFFYGVHISMHVVVDIIVSNLMFWKCKLICMHWCPHSLPLRTTSKIKFIFHWLHNECVGPYICNKGPYWVSKTGLLSMGRYTNWFMCHIHLSSMLVVPLYYFSEMYKGYCKNLKKD